MNISRGRGIADADRDVRLFLIRVAGALGDLLGDTLAALYVNGSLATGSYYRDRSDVNLIAVVSRALTPAERERVARLLLRLSDERPMRGDIAVDVVTQYAARNFEQPFSLELQYDRATHEAIRRRRIDYLQNRASIELAARIAEVRERGVTLVGPQARSLFAPVPWHAYMASLESILRAAQASLEDAPAAAILQACRVLYGTSNSAMHAANKEEAAVWVLRSIPAQYHSAVNDALQLYRGSKDPDDVVFDVRAAAAFADYVRERSTAAFVRAADTGEDEHAK